MRLLELDDILDLHRLVIQQTGGAAGVRDFGSLLSAIAQPGMTFGDTDLYPSLVEKASALAFSLVQNHPFVDGNKRVGHAAVDLFLVLNGFEICADIDEQERIILDLASATITREDFTSWLQAHLVPRQ